MSPTLRSLLDEARARDAADPLRHLRQRFALPRDAQGRPLTYLCGHSLGLAPLAARDRVLEELDDWARLGVAGHHEARRPWIGYAEGLREDLAMLVGASGEEVVAMNSLTVNLHLLMASFYRPQGKRVAILIEQGAFSSDRHAVESQLRWHGLDPAEALIELAPPPGEDLVQEQHLESLLEQTGSRVALVLWPGVQFRTGQAFDLTRIAAAAARAGARCGFDLAHSVGNLPLNLHDTGADFAVWCGYKYLNGGPGALAGAFVHQRHSTSLVPRLAGWWGHDPDSRFQMLPGFQPARGAAGWQVSNPPILSAAPLIASLALFREAGMSALAAKATAMGSWLERLLREHFAASLQVVTPAARGCQLSLRVRGGSTAGRALFAALGQNNVVADWREPDIIRVAPVPLYNGFEDCARLVQVLGEVLG